MEGVREACRHRTDTTDKVDDTDDMHDAGRISHVQDMAEREVDGAMTGRSRSALAGLLAAAVAVATAEFAAGLSPGGRSPLVAVGDAVIGLTPGPVVRFAIATFGGRNREVLLLSLVIVAALAGAALGVAAARRRWTGVVGLAAFGALGVAASLADPLAPTTSAVLAPSIGVVVGVTALEVLLRAAARAGRDPDLEPVEVVAAEQRRGPTTSAADQAGVAGDPPLPAWVGAVDPTRPAPPARSRREFFVVALAAAGTAASLGVVGRTMQGRRVSDAARDSTTLPAPRRPVGPPPAGTELAVPDISPLVTPTADFYRIDTAFTVPRIDPSSHRIRVTGMVDRPFELSYGDLLDLVDTEAYVTLSCVSNEVGGNLIGNARWLGVPLADLLDRAGVQPGADQIVGRSVDGWTGGFPVEAAFDGRTALVAVGMNGEPLPAQHGFPVRLVISGLYGYVSDTKWLSEIELTTFADYDAYWIPRGWAQHGPIKTQSRIDVPRTGSSFGPGEVVVAGVAWSDERGVTAVEVSVDEGPWQPAELADELATTSWRQWRAVWDAPSGEHLVRVRAFDADGTPQIGQPAPPAPDGATGYHTIRVSIP